jgi:hypothetical protein
VDGASIRNGGKGDLGAAYEQFKVVHKAESVKTLYASMRRGISKTLDVQIRKESMKTLDGPSRRDGIKTLDGSSRRDSIRTLDAPSRRESVKTLDRPSRSKSIKTLDVPMRNQSFKERFNAKVEDDMVDDDDDTDNDTDGIIIKEEILQEDQSMMTMVVVDFIHKVIPSRNLFQEKEGNLRKALLRNHDYIRAFSSSKINMSRTCRFIEILILVLSKIFVATLFFGICYPSDGTCNVYTTEVRNTPCKVNGFQSR